jgi:hypothetical protein
MADDDLTGSSMNPIGSDDNNPALPRRVLIAVDSSTASRNALAYASGILPQVVKSGS